MKNFYKVNLYQLEKYRNVRKIGTIIVENGIFYAKEIMTKQKFRIYPTINQISGREKDEWMNKYQQYLFLVERDFLDKNIVTTKELEEYINDFELEKCCFSKIINRKGKRVRRKKKNTRN